MQARFFGFFQLPSSNESYTPEKMRPPYQEQKWSQYKKIADITGPGQVTQHTRPDIHNRHMATPCEKAPSDVQIYTSYII